MTELEEIKRMHRPVFKQVYSRTGPLKVVCLHTTTDTDSCDDGLRWIEMTYKDYANKSEYQ